MTDVDTKGVRTPGERVVPSSRDPIAHWLDVFTSLLAVSSKHRLRIRDELEDHLRMRAEDLMILGMPEPEAIQRAVKELGETAELAQRFQEASTHSSHARRRTVMHSLLFAAAGMGLTVGALNLTNAPTTPASLPTALSLPQQDLESPSPAPFGLVRDLDPGTIGDAFREIAEQNEAKLFVHWASLENVGAASEDTELPEIPAGGLPMSKALELINSVLFIEGTDRIDVRFADGLMEFATARFFDAHEIVTSDYDVSVLVPTEKVMQYTTEGENLRSSIMAIIEPSIWDDDDGLGAIVINGSHLSVRAPQRVQVEVHGYLERLKLAMHQQMMEREHLLRSKKEELNARQLRDLEMLEQRRVETIDQMDFFRHQLESVSKGYWEEKLLAAEIELEYSQALDAASREQLRAKLIEAKAKLEAGELDRELAKDRIHRFQSELREIESRLLSEQPHKQAR